MNEHRRSEKDAIGRIETIPEFEGDVGIGIGIGFPGVGDEFERAKVEQIGARSARSALDRAWEAVRVRLASSRLGQSAATWTSGMSVVGVLESSIPEYGPPRSAMI